MNFLKRRYVIMTGLLLSVFILLAGCSTTKLASAFNEQTVKDTAAKAVEDCGKGDFESVWNLFSKDMQAEISADALKQSIQTVAGDAGGYKAVKSMEVVGQKDKATNEDVAVVVLVAEYDKKNITYTISFNTDMKIIGFYLK